MDGHGCADMVNGQVSDDEDTASESDGMDTESEDSGDSSELADKETGESILVDKINHLTLSLSRP